MDELDLLRDLRSEVPATQADLSRGRAALLKEIEGGRTERYIVIRLPVRRTAWLTATGMAAVVALILVVTQGVVGRITGGTAAGGRAGGGHASVAPSPTRPDHPAASLGAAPVTLRESAGPIRPDQYVFVDEFVQQPLGLGGYWTEVQSWLSVDGTRDGMRREGRLGTDTWTESPIRGGGCPQVLGPDGKMHQPNCPLNPAYHPDMPTTVDAMSAYLIQLDKERRPDVPPYAGLILTIAQEILQSQYLSPASLSAMFNALKATPELSVGTDAVDALGRPGLSINYDTPGGQTRVEFMFDANTYAYHGIRTVYLKDLSNQRKGDVNNGRVRRQIAIVDRVGQLP